MSANTKTNEGKLSHEQIVTRIAEMCGLELTDEVMATLLRMVTNDVPIDNIMLLISQMKNLNLSTAAAPSAAAAAAAAAPATAAAAAKK